MSFSNLMRNKRYKVKKDKTVILVIEDLFGTKFEFKLIDCSFTGLLVSGDISNNDVERFQEDTIIPLSKILFNNEDIILGRLVLRRVIRKDEKEFLFAFSLVDGKIPIDGKVSHFLDIIISDNGNDMYKYELNPDKFNLSSFIEQDYSNTDIFDRTKKFSIFCEQWVKSNKYAYFFPRVESKGPRVLLSKIRKNGRNDYLMFGSNDYLGLASNPEVMEEAKKAIEKYGVGSTGTAPTTGTSDLHEKLCDKVARLYGKEDCLIYSSGYGTNLGVIAALSCPQDLIVADILSHASIQDGMSMSHATSRLYMHNDMKHLEKILKENREKYAGCLIATEGAFSMDGTIGRIDKIVEIANKYNARTYIDVGHCIGVLGERGLGTTEFYKVTEKTDIIMGLFSKGIGTLGGFVVGDKNLINWLRWYSHSLMFATSFPPLIAAATMKALDIATSRFDLREKLKNNIAHFVAGLNNLGCPISKEHMTPIIPVEIRNEIKMGEIFQFLLESGIFVLPVAYPVVRKNRCRFRFSIRADHSISDLDYTLSMLKQAFQKTNFSYDDFKD